MAKYRLKYIEPKTKVPFYFCGFATRDRGAVVIPLLYCNDYLSKNNEFYNKSIYSNLNVLKTHIERLITKFDTPKESLTIEKI